jgi:RimJ/RimL family protein N-acetyltransferase
LILRPWVSGDAAVLLAAWEDEAIATASAVPAEFSLSSAHDWIVGAARRFDARVAVDFVIERGGVVVGEVGLGPIDIARRAAFVGYWVLDAHRGDGVATVALARLITWVVDSSEFDVLLARTTAENLGSIAVLERNGFSRLATPPLTWAREMPAQAPTRSNEER